jgi:hypothetical protein
MKNINTIVTGIISLSILVLLTACGGSKGEGNKATQKTTAGKKSTHFVELLDFIADENKALDELETKAKKSTDLNQALKINQQYEEQVKTADENIASKLAKTGNRVDIPFTQDILTDVYTLKQLWIAEANHKNLIIKAEIEESGPVAPKYIAFITDSGEIKACTVIGQSVGFPPSRIYGSTKAQVTDKATYDAYRKR